MLGHHDTDDPRHEVHHGTGTRRQRAVHSHTHTIVPLQACGELAPSESETWRLLLPSAGTALHGKKDAGTL